MSTVVDLKLIPDEKERSMSGFFHNKKRIAYIFAIGFCIGFCLEVLFVEYGKDDYQKPDFSFIKQHQYDDNTSKISLTCLILMKHDHDKNLIASETTWLRHCDDHYAFKLQRTKRNQLKPTKKSDESYSPVNALIKFITNYKICDKSDPMIPEWNRTRKKIVEGNSAWSGLCKAFHFVKNSKSQWFLIIPDNLFVLINNLKYFVKDLNWKHGHYYGYVIKDQVADYNTLTAGILLSRGSLEALMKVFKTENDCDNKEKFWRKEDLYLGKYLKQIGILPQDTRDSNGRGRFNAYNLNTLLYPGKLYNESDYRRRALYPQPVGFDCCSPYLITIDVSGSDKIYYHYYYLYTIQTRHKKLPPIKKYEKKDDFYWKQFLRNEGYDENAIEKMSQEEYYNIWVKKMPPERFYEKLRNTFTQ